MEFIISTHDLNICNYLYCHKRDSLSVSLKVGFWRATTDSGVFADKYIGQNNNLTFKKNYLGTITKTYDQPGILVPYLRHITLLLVILFLFNELTDMKKGHDRR